MIQDLPSDSLDGEFSDNQEYAAVNAADVVAELEAESFNYEDEEIFAVLPRPFGSKKMWGSLMTKTNLLTAPMQMHHIPYEIRMNHIKCWLPRLNLCKVTYHSKAQ